MPAPLSIVLPTLNAAGSLPATLASLMAGLEAGVIHELIISDGGSTDATRKIAEDVGAKWVEGPPGRGGQLKRGRVAANGKWMLFLHADTQLPPEWPKVVLAHIQSTENAGYFRLSFDARGVMPTLFSAGANFRSRLGLPYGDQGLLVSASVYDAIGGYDDIPLMEDVAMARKLRGRLNMLKAAATTSADRFQKEGWFRRGARNLWTLTRYLAGADPSKLAKRYNR